MKLFAKHKIYTEAEVRSRYEILLETYCKTLNIESLTMLDMAKKEIIPAVCFYMKDLSESALNKKAVSSNISCELEEK